MRKPNGSKTNTFFWKITKKGKTVVNYAFLFSKTKILRNLWNFLRDHTVAPFRNSDCGNSWKKCGKRNNRGNLPHFLSQTPINQPQPYCWQFFLIINIKKKQTCWPGVAGAVLQTPLSFIDLLINWFTQRNYSSKSSKHLHSQTVKAKNLKCWEQVHLPPPVIC